jgi:hypothetical protein
MSETASSSALVIGGRYLASPAGLRARPDGPLDALDTQSGRTAQVRILFASDGWDDDDAFADAVSRWCALASSEICGVLDFGEHEGRRYLVVAPSLGMSIERWQLTRRPAAADAARLALAFGRLAERIAAAGFPVDACHLSDCAVGPGPTPFLERPLLGSPTVNPVLTGPREGQRTLAAILRAAGGGPLPEPLERWTAQAASAGFGTLAECLDDLEARGNEVRDEPGDQPLIDMTELFDDDEAFEARLLAPAPRVWPRRLLGGMGALALAALAIAAIGHIGGAHRAVAAGPPPPRPVAAAATEPKAPATHHRRARHHVRPATPRRHHHRHHPVPPAVPAGPVPTATATPPAGQAPVAGTPLPDPGTPGTLPAPR